MLAELEAYVARQERAAKGLATRRANEAKKAEQRAKRRVKRGLPAERAPAVAPKKAHGHSDKRTAAKRGHERRKKTTATRERFHVNSEDENAAPGERLTGETPVTLYESAHPEHGTHEDKELWHGRVKRFFGHRVKLTANGERRSTEDDTLGEKVSRIYIARVGDVKNYADVFGSDGLYYKVMKAIFEADSDGECVITSLTFEVADGSAVDAEDFSDA